MKRAFQGSLICLLLCFSCQIPQEKKHVERPKIKGLTFVAPRDSFLANPMRAVTASGAGWIAVVPYAFNRLGETQIHYETRGRWWGERPEGVKTSIQLAKASGLNVMLKPQVWVPGSWPGEIRFDQMEDWEKWEQSYSAYILPMAELAAVQDIPLFCIGTEFKYSVAQRPEYWKSLIKEIRRRYKGQLVYAANWDDYPDVSFWNQLDFIGVDAYFPLSESPEPSVEELSIAWAPVREKLRNYSRKTGRRILFTEFGYLSVDGCAGKTWELEKKLPQLAINQRAQTNAMEALFRNFWKEPFWAGGFLWKWYPQVQPNSRRLEKDYTPQGKLAEITLRSWYQ